MRISDWSSDVCSSDLTEGLYAPAHPAARSVKNSARNAGHGGWQSEGKVDQRVDDLLSGKFIAHQHPGNKQPEEGVDGGRNSSRTKAQAIGGNRPVRKADSHEFFPTHSRSTNEYGAQWNKPDQCEPDQDETEREAKASNRKSNEQGKKR